MAKRQSSEIQGVREPTDQTENEFYWVGKSCNLNQLTLSTNHHLMYLIRQNST